MSVRLALCLAMLSSVWPGAATAQESEAPPLAAATAGESKAPPVAGAIAGESEAPPMAVGATAAGRDSEPMLVRAPAPTAIVVDASSVLGELPPQLAQRLRGDSLVMLPAEPGDRAVRALVIFDQPLPTSMRLLTQTQRHGEFRPEIREVRNIEWSDARILDEHRMKIMFMRIDYRLLWNINFPAALIAWEIDPDFDNDLEYIEGEWRLYELDRGHTLARFRTRVDVKRAMPKWMQDLATRKNVPQSMERAKLWVDSGGTWRP